MIASLAGKTTLAAIGISFLANLTVSKGLAYIFGVGGVSYGLGERYVRRKTVRRTGGRIKELEARIDPKRSSSNLTEAGEAPSPEHDGDES